MVRATAVGVTPTVIELACPLKMLRIRPLVAATPVMVSPAGVEAVGVETTPDVVGVTAAMSAMWSSCVKKVCYDGLTYTTACRRLFA
jgi:hypothetical protein